MPYENNSLTCAECRRRCRRIIELRIGSENVWGSEQALKEGRPIEHEDAFFDGLNEAIGTLYNETGIYWGQLRKEIKEAEGAA